MKLIIQIPCYNEAETLEIALNDLPKQIDGIDEIEYLIINDGSSDNTVEVAKNWGVHYVVNFKQNKGLAKGFMAGLDACYLPEIHEAETYIADRVRLMAQEQPAVPPPTITTSYFINNSYSPLSPLNFIYFEELINGLCRNSYSLSSIISLLLKRNSGS